MTPEILFSRESIAARVEAIAAEIAASALKPDIAAPILVGAYVFAADLLRALCEKGLMLPVQFLWLRSYDNQKSAGEVKVLVGPTDEVRGRTVLLIDGVLDSGATIATAKDLLLAEGAGAVIVAVAVDKNLPHTPAQADFACFTNVKEFVVGYGMDDCGAHRGLPYIGKF